MKVCHVLVVPLCFMVKGLIQEVPCHFKEIFINPQMEQVEEREISFIFQNKSAFEVTIHFYLETDTSSDFVYKEEVDSDSTKENRFYIWESQIPSKAYLHFLAFNDYETFIDSSLPIPKGEVKEKIVQDEGVKIIPFTWYRPGAFLDQQYELYFENLDPYIWTDIPIFSLKNARFRLEDESEEIPLNHHICRLEIYHSKDIFPLFWNEQSQASIFDYTLEQNDSWWEIRLDQTFYLEKKTGMISPVMKEGFVRTNQIHLPFEVLSIIEEVPFSFYIFGIGRCNFTARYDGKFTFSYKEKGETYGNYYVETKWERGL